MKIIQQIVVMQEEIKRLRKDLNGVCRTTNFREALTTAEARTALKKWINKDKN
jgi:hypothetical protein